MRAEGSHFLEPPSLWPRLEPHRTQPWAKSSLVLGEKTRKPFPEAAAKPGLPDSCMVFKYTGTSMKFEKGSQPQARKYQKAHFLQGSRKQATLTGHRILDLFFKVKVATLVASKVHSRVHGGGHHGLLCSHGLSSPRVPSEQN